MSNIITLKAGLPLYHTTLRKVENPIKPLDYYFDDILDKNNLPDINRIDPIYREKAKAYFNLAPGEILHDHSRPTDYCISHFNNYGANNNECVSLLFSLSKNINLLDLRSVSIADLIFNPKIFNSLPPNCDGYIFPCDTYEIHIINNAHFVSPSFSIFSDLISDFSFKNAHSSGFIRTFENSIISSYSL